MTDRPSRRRTRPFGRTVGRRVLVKVVAAERDAAPEPLPERPRTRAECPDARPCPWVGCRHHLYLDANPETGGIKFNFPDLEPWELEHSCALDVAERGEQTVDDIGLLLNVSHARVGQIVDRTMLILRDRLSKE